MLFRNEISKVRGHLISTPVLSKESEDKQTVYMQNMDLQGLSVPEKDKNTLPNLRKQTQKANKSNW